VFIGLLPVAEEGDAATTLAVNPRLKLTLGSPAARDADVSPFAPERFVEPTARTAWLTLLARTGSVTDYPLHLRRDDGATVWVEVTARAEVQQEGLLRVEALVRDVSERRREDEHSRDLYQQIQQADKMAALGQTISGVAHELNNPLATILSWAERLAERVEDDTSRRGVDIILTEAERAARIVRNLLTLARKRVSTRAMIDLNRVVQDTLDRRPDDQRHPRIEVSLALADRLPEVFADAHQIQQVLLNLISNAEHAILAAHGRGTIAIRTRGDLDRESVVMEVADTGPGVPAEMRSRIFDPFFTTKEVGKGTGLGLTVAYAIIQEHAGRIRLDSPVSGGATFVVELPLGLPQAEPRPQAEGDSWERVKGASVLLVEDETSLAAAVSEALTDVGLVVDLAGDGQEALARVRRNSYDAVICDLKMPRVDGMMLYRAMAAATPALARRVIFVTGDVAGTDAERFLADSGCRWLAKPFRLADLLRAIRETLG
jgi:signal transduction histidine kinase/BarA-like signal transduction histidine kinase